MAQDNTVHPVLCSVAIAAPFVCVGALCLVAVPITVTQFAAIAVYGLVSSFVAVGVDLAGWSSKLKPMSVIFAAIPIAILAVFYITRSWAAVSIARWAGLAVIAICLIVLASIGISGWVAHYRDARRVRPGSLNPTDPADG